MLKSEHKPSQINAFLLSKILVPNSSNVSFFWQIFCLVRTSIRGHLIHGRPWAWINSHSLWILDFEGCCCCSRTRGLQEPGLASDSQRNMCVVESEDKILNSKIKICKEAKDVGWRNQVLQIFKMRFSAGLQMPEASCFPHFGRATISTLNPASMISCW